MRKFVVTSFGLMMAILAASPIGLAAVTQFDGGGDGSSYLDPLNWDTNAVPVVGDQAIINNSLTASYATGASSSVSSLVIGADWPTTGDFGTAGTLNMSDGAITVTGGGNAFQIGRACCAGTGVMNMTGDAALTINGTDPVVGARDRGELNIGPMASVTSPNGYWRLGNYGPSIDAGLQGDGLLNVEGSFSAMVIFIGDSDSDGELRVSGNGTVTLADNLVPNVATGFPNRSSLVHMIGSNASLNALNLESANGAAQVHNKYEFSADLGGVSPITLRNAVNIDNNDLIVNLNGYALPVGGTLLLFDAAPGQVYGTFASSSVFGSVIPHRVIYDNVNGDILVQRIPEPSTMLLLGLGMIVAIATKRRASR
jgi:PEP-CTERM motif